jgi:hypothetical protein
MCYYGVNFLLSAGLHSYGFGDGGIQYAIGYVVVEAIIIGAAVVKKMDEPTSPRQKNEPRESALDQETGEPA